MSIHALKAWPPPFSEDESPLLSHTHTPTPSARSPHSAVLPNAARRAIVLRAAYQGLYDTVGDDRRLILIDPSDQTSFRKYLASELEVLRLNRIHHHLWAAGLPNCARQLTRQVTIDRKILLTERADLHLLWRDNWLLLKPLPEFLLDTTIWQDHICQDQALYKDANGFLLSYMWLVNQASDLKIAHDEGLISCDISWDRWVEFSKAVLARVDHQRLTNVNPRYMYGELRITRLNIIWRLFYFSNRALYGSLLRGYEHGYYNQYSTFIKRNFSWLLVVFIYITIVLTAMQVGLGTSQLRDNDRFNSASYGFTVFAIVMPLFGILMATGVLAVVAVLNYTHNLDKHSAARHNFSALFENPRLQNLEKIEQCAMD